MKPIFRTPKSPNISLVRARDFPEVVAVSEPNQLVDSSGSINRDFTARPGKILQGKGVVPGATGELGIFTSKVLEVDGALSSLFQAIGCQDERVACN